MLAFNCPKCGAQLLFETATPGMNVKCPPCGAIVQAPGTFTEVSRLVGTITSDRRQCFNCGEFTPSPELVCRFCQASFRPLSVAVIGAFFILGGIVGVIGTPLLMFAGGKKPPLVSLVLLANLVFSGFYNLGWFFVAQGEAVRSQRCHRHLPHQRNIVWWRRRLDEHGKRHDTH
jgi:ribosomal protein S27AE